MDQTLKSTKITAGIVLLLFILTPAALILIIMQICHVICTVTA